MCIELLNEVFGLFFDEKMVIRKMIILVSSI